MIAADFLGIHFTGELPLGDLLVGLGTGALAFFTYRLATRTGDEVELTQKSLTVAQRTLEAQEAPFLVATFHRDDLPHADLDPVFTDEKEEPVGEEWTLSPRVENLGAGPAILYGAIAYPEGDSVPPSDVRWQAEATFRAGQEVYLAVRLTEAPAPGHRYTMVLFYRSASGVPYTSTHIVRVGQRGWAFRLSVKRAQTEPQG